MKIVIDSFLSPLSSLSLFVSFSWNFLTRHQQLQSTDNFFTSNPYLLHHTFLWAIFFSLIYFLTSYLSKTLDPKWYETLPKKKKSEVPTYALALSHHLLIVPASIYYIYIDYNLLPDQVEAYNYFISYAPLLPFTFGYFIADTILYTIPELISGRYAYFIHHIFAVLLLFSLATAGGPCVRALPHFLLMELSSIFFSSAWLLRQIGYRGSIMVTIFEQLFVLFYFILRILHMPCLLYALSSYVHTLGPFQYCLVGVMFLQIYWFYQIIQTLRVRDMGGAGKTPKNEENVKESKNTSTPNKCKEQ